MPGAERGVQGQVAQHGTAQHGMAQLGTAQHGTAWQSRAPARRSHSNRKLQQRECSSEQPPTQDQQREGEPEGEGMAPEEDVKGGGGGR